MALGADRDTVRRMVLRQGMKVVGVGIAIGVAAAVVLTRVLAGMLYGVSATDPLTYAGVALLLSGVAAAACIVPAVRATRVQPVAVLKEE